jgi:hypothetical protein
VSFNPSGPIRKLQLAKDAAHRLILRRWFFGREGLAVAEFGRMRSASEANRVADGWSTKRFAESPQVGVLYSVDDDSAQPGSTEQVCRESIDAEAVEKIVFLGDSARLRDPGVVQSGGLDLLYVDGPGSPLINLRFVLDCTEHLKVETLICVDDWSLRTKSVAIEQVFCREYSAVVIADTLVLWRPERPGKLNLYDLDFFPVQL